ncbi:hypothetical protein AGMMS50233_10910 [Endomicrobiia bacterium]|nr:hypothetical protein AGMMS50233_10910 [Endomicrobiia bacterium]
MVAESVAVGSKVERPSKGKDDDELDEEEELEAKLPSFDDSTASAGDTAPLTTLNATSILNIVLSCVA